MKFMSWLDARNMSLLDALARQMCRMRDLRACFFRVNSALAQAHRCMQFGVGL